MSEDSTVTSQVISKKVRVLQNVRIAGAAMFIATTVAILAVAIVL